MEAIDFKQRNVLIAEDQDEFMTLPAYVTQPGDGLPVRVVSKWKLSEEELHQVMTTGEIYLCTVTAGQALQPINASTMDPFLPETNDRSPTNTEYVMILPEAVFPEVKPFKPIDCFHKLPRVGFTVPRRLYDALVSAYRSHNEIAFVGDDKFPEFLPEDLKANISNGLSSEPGPSSGTRRLPDDDLNGHGLFEKPFDPEDPDETGTDFQK